MAATINPTILLLTISFLFLCPKISSNNTLLPDQLLSDPQTLFSANQIFELGFFTPNGTTNRYLGIWYKNITPFTVVWIANRYTPITDTSSGVLKIDNGVLSLNQGDTFIWSSDLPKQGSPVVDKPIAVLLDSGNFVLTREGDENYQWQSFDHATDTLLPGMKLGWDLDAGLNNSLVAWRGREDPSPGYYALIMDTSPSPEILVLKEQITVITKSGIWNGVGFSGTPEMLLVQKDFKFSFVLNERQKYYSFTGNESIRSRVVMERSGKLYRYVWLDEAGWITLWFAPQDKCDIYKACGPYGICNTNKFPICGCVKGFEPVNQREWELRDGISGCARKTMFVCGKDDGFLKLKRMKLPDGATSYYNKSMNIDDCRATCKKNCSCTAYAKSDIRDGASGCIFWIGDLVNMRQYSTVDNQDLFVRVAASELGTNHKTTVIIVAVTVSATILVLILIACCVCKKRRQKRKALELPLQHHLTFRASTGESFEDQTGLALYKFATMAAVTQKFSAASMLGEGGFGSVYKGILDDGVEVAIKRLSKDSKQGVDAFMKEVVVIAKLQHRNLVRLLGCCIDGEEKMLVYEYMSNKSLDTFLFDKTKRLALDWEKRFKIIEGVAKGLMYLHIDSRLRIIHRDLKASNILLDDEMNPKISDFGLAEIIHGNETEGSTTRITGTPGYMAPEYATEGKFSMESDVFSYGVLVLEILSGRRNMQVGSGHNEHNILRQAWQLMQKEKGAEFLDESLRNTHTINEAMRCLQIALLCVQENAEERPSIVSVVNKLCSENLTEIVKANMPGFPFRRPSDVSHYSPSISYESRRSTSSRCNSKKAILQGILSS